MDFDLNQVSLVTPSSLNLSKRNSNNGNNATESRFDSTVVGSVYHDNAQKLHSDLIGIEEIDEMDDKNISHNPNGTSLSYTKQQQTHIGTCKDSMNSYKAHNNIIASAGMYDTTKAHICFDDNVSSRKKDINSLQTLSNIHQPFNAFPNKHNEGQVSPEVEKRQLL